MAERKMSRKWLEALGLDADKIDAIVEAHSDAIQSIKDERDRLQGEKDDLRSKLDGIDQSKDWKKLYTDLVDENAKKEARTAKEAALRAIYSEAGVAEKYIGKLLRIADYDGVELDKDGNAKDHAKLVEAAKTEYAEFIPVKQKENGQKTPNPPAGNGGKTHMTKDEIMAIKDPAARQKAIAENMSEFGY